jgi:hydrogenase maturation protease
MSPAAKSIRIIGIGSPVAGDTLGIEAVQRLQHDALWRGHGDIDWVVLERPGAALLSQLAGVDAVYLIDALDHPVAGVHRISPEELLTRAGKISSHDFGVAEALLLAERLGQLPQRLMLYGITPQRPETVEGWYHELSCMLADDITHMR